jgi:hypothetical protein
MQLAKAAGSIGNVFLNRLRMVILEFDPFSSSKVDGGWSIARASEEVRPASLAAESAATAPTGYLPLISSP